MSRSRKKNRVWKDHGCPASFYNRKFRRVNKLRLRLGKDPLLLNEVVNGYIVCDYKLMYPKQRMPATAAERKADRSWLGYFCK